MTQHVLSKTSGQNGFVTWQPFLGASGMDIDGNGHLSLEEMLEGYDHNPEFKNLMQQMDCGTLRVCFSSAKKQRFLVNGLAMKFVA